MTEEHVTEMQFPAFDQNSFQTDVLDHDGLTVVDIWAEWCIPCKQLTKILKQVERDLPDDVRIGSLDADANPDLLAQYNVRGLPTLLYFKGGALVDASTGVDRKQVIQKTIAKHVANPA